MSYIEFKNVNKNYKMGEITIKATQLISPPKKEAIVVIVSAFPAIPFSRKAGPSNKVAAAAAVPGVLIKIAVIEPA